MLLTFNESRMRIHYTPTEQPSQEEIRQTPGLLNASLQDAFMYGGPVVRQALSSLHDVNTRYALDPSHTVVDVKVHMLMKDMNPAIPGWHTDGVFRDSNGVPDIVTDSTLPPINYLLWVSGSKALTQFFSPVFRMDVPENIGSALYHEMNIRVNEFLVDWKFSDDDKPSSLVTTVPSCQWVSWNSKNIHRGVPATGSEWRVLIRIAMAARLQPEKDLRKVIRTQQQIYCSENYGW